MPKKYIGGGGFDTRPKTSQEKLSEMQRRVASKYGSGYTVTPLREVTGERVISGPNRCYTTGYMHRPLKDGEEIVVNELGGFKISPPGE